MYVRTQWQCNDSLHKKKGPAQAGSRWIVVVRTTAVSTGTTFSERAWKFVGAFCPDRGVFTLYQPWIAQKKKTLRRSSKGYDGRIANFWTLNCSLSSTSTWPHHDSRVLYACLKQHTETETRLAGEITVQLYATPVTILSSSVECIVTRIDSKRPFIVAYRRGSLHRPMTQLIN